MALKYPSGKEYRGNKPNAARRPADDYANRGMTLEDDLNATNEYYRERGIAVIHKNADPGANRARRLSETKRRRHYRSLLPASVDDRLQRCVPRQVHRL